ncbi:MULTISPECIES: hypothetical protein [unclassified Leptolyngbya]|uniref:hypothetical protein n=1 Tax=unclassified Leptolyngbya TaxID=2650499 RepID=UPI003D318F05
MPLETLAKEVEDNIETAIEPVKKLRFLFETQLNGAALQQLRTALQTELSLLKAAEWGVDQRVQTLE